MVTTENIQWSPSLRLPWRNFYALPQSDLPFEMLAFYWSSIQKYAFKFYLHQHRDLWPWTNNILESYVNVEISFSYVTGLVWGWFVLLFFIRLFAWLEFLFLWPSFPTLANLTSYFSLLSLCFLYMQISSVKVDSLGEGGRVSVIQS